MRRLSRSWASMGRGRRTQCGDFWRKPPKGSAPFVCTTAADWNRPADEPLQREYGLRPRAGSLAFPSGCGADWLSRTRVFDEAAIAIWQDGQTLPRRVDRWQPESQNRSEEHTSEL